VVPVCPASTSLLASSGRLVAVGKLLEKVKRWVKPLSSCSLPIPVDSSFQAYYRQLCFHRGGET